MIIDIQSARKTQLIEDHISNISLDWLSGDVRIRRSNTEWIEIMQYADQKFAESKLFDAQVVNGALTVVDGRKRKLHIGFNFHRTMLELHLPSRLFQSLSIQGTGSSILVEDLQATTCSCRITSGKATLSGTITNLDVRLTGSQIVGEQLAVQKLHLQATSSQIELSGALHELDTKITGSSMRIESSSLIQRLQSTSTGANVILSIPENDGFTLRYKSAGGQVKSDFPLVTQGNVHSYKNGESTFTAEVRGGKFTILRN